MALADPGGFDGRTPVSCHHAPAHPLSCAEGPSRMSSFLQGYKGMNLAVCGLAPATVTMLCQDTKETPMSLVEVFLP